MITSMITPANTIIPTTAATNMITNMNTSIFEQKKLVRQEMAARREAAQPEAWACWSAELVSQRYGISREAQDEYLLRSQQRVAAAQAKHDEA